MNKSSDEIPHTQRAVPVRASGDPTAPLDATAALEGIRAVMDVMHVPAADKAAAAGFRLIRAILDRAPRSLPEA